MGGTAREAFHDFGSFYREYAKTGIHAAATAALTGFGLLTILHPGFVVVAVGVYVLPPVYLYLTSGEKEEQDADSDESAETKPRMEADSASETGEIGWTETDTPTDEALYDVAMSRDGPYAVGANGTVLAHQAGSDGWDHVVEEGPTVQSNDLRGVDVPSDGRHVWFAGDSGVLAQYAVDSDRLTDYSAPNDITSNWVDIAITGSAGDESIYLVSGSGEILRGANRGGDIRWGSTVKPGSGSSMASVEFTDESENRGYLCDTNQTVYETTDGGESYAIIGIENANCTFTDIAIIDPEQIIVSGDDGTVSRYDTNSENWTTLSVDEHAITAIDGRNGDGLASSERGTIYEYTSNGWESVSHTTLMNATLHGIALGTDASGVAVGDNGTVIYKQG
jgi:photosystem II stability/assembly factor-like uncharacterized protein